MTRKTAVQLARTIQASDFGDYVYWHEPYCGADEDADCDCEVLALRCGARA